MRTIDTAHLGLRGWHDSFPVTDIPKLEDPASAVLPSGDLPLHRTTLTALAEYSSTLPTGTGTGKVWKRHLPAVDEWWLGRYGEPYPDGHEHHGSIPIDWWRIYITGQAARFPRDIQVPRPRGRGPVAAPLGGLDGEEGHHCLRDTGRGFCLTRIEYLPDARLGGCWCPSGNPPCGYCTSSAPQCPGCGWRADD